MFRKINHSDDLKSQIYLHSIIGKNEFLNAAFKEIKEKEIDYIISLTEDEETQRISPIYWDAIERGKLPCERLSYPIQDYGAPEDKEEFLSFIRTVKDLFEQGSSFAFGYLWFEAVAGASYTAKVETR